MFRAALGALAILGIACTPSKAEDKTIRMGTMSWEDVTPLTAITKKVLEDAGYKVELTSFSEWGIAHAALAKGDTQIMVSETDYNAHDFWNRNKNRYEKISPVSHGLVQAIAVPKYVTIDSLEQLNEAADKFGNKIIGIEPGAGLMRDIGNAISAYDLKLQLVEGSTAAMTAALKSAVDRGEWIAVALWQPSWMAQKFDIKWLEDPKSVFPPSQTYNWIAHKGFSEKYPQARELIASIYVPLADNNAINEAISDGKSFDEAITDWFEKNSDLVERWTNIKKY